jgi:phosphatidylglycerophosphate synthase
VSAPIDHALILTTGSLLDGTPGPDRSCPLTIVGGLSLFQRTFLTLQRAGISHFMILGGDQSEALRAQLRGDRRVTAEVRWLPVREFPPSDPRTWEILSSMMGGGYIIAASGAIFSQGLIRRLREEVQSGTAVVITRHHAGVEDELSATVSNRRGTEDGVVMVESRIQAPPASSSAAMLDLVAIPHGFTLTGWAGGEDGPHPMQAALERGLRQGQVKAIGLGEEWYQEVPIIEPGSNADATSVAQAERTLARSLKGGPEGFIDHYFNRKCSRWLTHWLLQTPLTPNVVTLLATAVGLMAAGAFAVGTYPAGIVGALLFQLSAILDCCDGEVARLKFLESPLGEQLDIVLDNVVHIAIFAGMAWGAVRGQAACAGLWESVFAESGRVGSGVLGSGKGDCASGWGSWPLLFGALAIVGNIAAFEVVQAAKRARNRLDESRRATIDKILNTLASRDFSVIILGFALIGQLEWFLVLAAIGSNIFWPFLAWQLRSRNLV